MNGEEFARVERCEDMPAVLGLEGAAAAARPAIAHADAVGRPPMMLDEQKPFTIWRALRSRVEKEVEP
jgi:hypothetical protein